MFGMHELAIWRHDKSQGSVTPIHNQMKLPSENYKKAVKNLEEDT